MKILIMNDLLVYGGAELQSRREKEILEQHGHDVCLLTFDNHFPVNHPIYNPNNGYLNIPLKNTYITKLVHKIFPYFLLIQRTRRILKEIKPEVIHVNNFHIAPKSLYRALANFKVVQTIRDYSAVCPLGTSVYSDYSVCKGYNQNNCLARCKLWNSPIKLFRYINFKSIKKLRHKFVNQFIAPSASLTKYCLEHGYNIVNINNPFYANVNPCKVKNEGKKRYLYFGIINEKKGVFKLLDAFEQFAASRPGVTLSLAGIVEPQFECVFREILDKSPWLEYLGVLDNVQILELLQEIYAIVVPSMWMENYPNTVLEGMAMECLVLGANRGGIPELVGDLGLLFDPLDRDSLLNALEKSNAMSYIQYLDITKRASRKILDLNSSDTYFDKIMNVFSETIATYDI